MCACVDCMAQNSSLEDFFWEYAPTPPTPHPGPPKGGTFLQLIQLLLYSYLLKMFK